MSTKTRLLQFLEENTNQYISGQAIGTELQVSRNAIWKAIKQLQKEGYSIESKTSIGYRLQSGNNLLTATAISSMLNAPYNLKVYDSIGSTNDEAKATYRDGERPLLIVSNQQTAGRGRQGRTFESPSGTGLYLSLAITPDFDIEKSLYVTMSAALAVCRAIEKVAGKRSRIKWVNDVFINKKKVCGILTEAQTDFETGKISTLIIGIGINCFPGNFSHELEGVAGFVSDERNSFSRAELAAEIVNQLMTLLAEMPSNRFLSEYRTKCFILGKKILIHPNFTDKTEEAMALDIDDNGGLVVKYLRGIKMQQIETLTTGEVSISVQP